MNFSSRNEKRRLRLAEEIARHWNEERLNYAVVHGLQFYPAKIGRDLDITARLQDVRRLCDVAIKVGRAHGFSNALLRWSHWGLYQLVLLSDDLECALPLDFLCTEQVWRAKVVWIMDRDTFERVVRGDDWVGPFRVSTEGTFYKTYLRALLCGDLRRFGKEYSLPACIPKEAYEKVKDILGRRIELLTNKTDVELSAEFPKALWELQIVWALRHPVKALVSLKQAVESRIKRHLFNPAEIIMMCVDDISRYAGSIEETKGIAKGLFIDLRIRLTKGRMLGIRRLQRFLYPPISEFVVILVLFEKKSEVKECSYGNSGKIDVREEVIKAAVSALLRKYDAALFGWKQHGFGIG